MVSNPLTLKGAIKNLKKIKKKKETNLGEVTIPKKTIDTPDTVTKTTQDVPSVFTDSKTGRPSGISLPNGKTFFGLSPDEVNQIAKNEFSKTAIPEGTVLQSQLAQQKQEASQVQQAFQQVGTSGTQPTVDLGNQASLVNPSNALQNLPSIAAGATAGAGTGALIGSAVPVLGTAVGAGVGGIIGGLTAYLGSLTVDKRQATRNAFQVYQTASGERNKQLLNLANSGVYPKADLLKAYDQNLANIRESERALKQLTKGKINEDLSGAQDELIEVQSYLDNEPFYLPNILIAKALASSSSNSA